MAPGPRLRLAAVTFLALGVATAICPARAQDRRLAIIQHQSQAIMHLREAIRLGDVAVRDMAALDSRDRLNEVLPGIRVMLDHAKHASSAMGHMRALMTFKDPLLDWQIARAEATHGMIRWPLDQTGRDWSGYHQMAVHWLTDAVATLRQVLELLQ